MKSNICLNCILRTYPNFNVSGASPVHLVIIGIVRRLFNYYFFHFNIRTFRCWFRIWNQILEVTPSFWFIGENPWNRGKFSQTSFFHIWIFFFNLFYVFWGVRITVFPIFWFKKSRSAPYICICATGAACQYYSLSECNLTKACKDNSIPDFVIKKKLQCPLYMHPHSGSGRPVL